MAAEKGQPAQPEATPRTAKPAPEELEELREHVPADIRSVQFPVSVRGYDRDAVDAYVKRVNRVIAELEISRSPRAAVRHALDRVGKQTVAVLQEARESADKLLEAARDEADAEKDRAKAEVAKLVVNASDEADRTKAEADTEAVWNERGRLLEETQAMAQKLQELASGAAARLGDDHSEQQTIVVEPQPQKDAPKPR